MSLTDDPVERDAIAGEYVLGTLEPAEHAAVEAALATDVQLREAVYRWQDRLLPLALDVAPIEPAADGWSAVAARLAAASPPMPMKMSAPTRDHTAPAANEPGLRRLRIWQSVAGLALAACLVMALLLARGVIPEAAEQRYLAWLQPPQASAQAGWLVEVTAGRTVRLLPVAGTLDAVPPGKVLQFWTKLEGAAAPTSLGLIAPNQTTELPAQRLPGVGERQLFELTLEPDGGSPTGRPTGPVLYVGRSFRI